MNDWLPLHFGVGGPVIGRVWLNSPRGQAMCVIDPGVMPPQKIDNMSIYTKEEQ